MDSASVSSLRRLLDENGLRPKKGLGQNFLVDKNILKKITAACELEADDLVIEIGAGMGALTLMLAAQAGNVVTVEIDTGLLPVLADGLIDYPNVRLVAGDIMNLDWEAALLSTFSSDKRFKVCANLPYYITTPVIFRILEHSSRLEQAVLMMQKEVADRLMAQPGTKEYGLLTVMLAYRAKVYPVTKVSRNCFYPQPEVDSSVVKLVPHAEPPVVLRNEPLFMRLVRESFQKRRKTMQNVLNSASWLSVDGEAILTAAGIEPKRRGETLTLQEFGRLADELDLAGGVKHENVQSKPGVNEL